MPQDQLDIDYWMLVFVIANFALTVLVGGYQYFKSRSAVTKQAIDEVHQKVDKHSSQSTKQHSEIKERVVALEQRPRHDQEIIEIHKRINDTTEGFKKLEGRFDETAGQVNRIHDYLMNKGH